MNEIVSNFLLAGDKFMPEIHLRQTEFTYSTCWSLKKSKNRIQKLNETGDSRCIYKKEPDKTCFQLDKAYGDFKDLTRRTDSDKILCDKAFNIAKSRKHDGYQHGIDPMVYKSFGKETSSKMIKIEIMSNKELAEKLHKPIIKKFKKRKVYSFFIDNIWSADFADM